MKQISTLAAAVFLAGAAVLPVQKGLAQMNVEQNTVTQPSGSHPYVGMWVTADGYIRHNLLPNCRYDEARAETVRARTRGAMRSEEITSTIGTIPALPLTERSLTACCITRV